jgi:hypothetical protein
MSDGSPGWPAEAGEVEVIAVRDESGALRPEMIAVVEADFERLEERARGEADEDAQADEEEANERDADARRDDRMTGGW